MRKADRAEFCLRRLHSLSGVIPLFVFVPVHLIQKGIPFFTFVFNNDKTLLVIFGVIPFFLHALIGMGIIIKNRSGVMKKQPGKLFRLQIISSVLILFFLPLHIRLFSLLETAATYPALYGAMAVFAIGIAAIAFHIAHGAYTFCLTWGICVTRPARKAVRIVSAALGIAFCLGGMVFYFFVFDAIRGMVGL